MQDPKVCTDADSHSVCWSPLRPGVAVYHWRAHAPDLTEHGPGLLLLLVVVNGLEPSLEL